MSKERMAVMEPDGDEPAEPDGDERDAGDGNDLLDVAKGGGPVENEIGPWRSLSMLAAELEMRQRVVAAEAA